MRKSLSGAAELPCLESPVHALRHAMLCRAVPCQPLCKSLQFQLCSCISAHGSFLWLHWRCQRNPPLPRPQRFSLHLAELLWPMGRAEAVTNHTGTSAPCCSVTADGHEADLFQSDDFILFFNLPAGLIVIVAQLEG